ncbi:MAG: sugar transporter [Nitrospirales bacterium]|nr:MAG: sugar transporter [Nitrospirales bacterium]
MIRKGNLRRLLSAGVSLLLLSSALHAQPQGLTEEQLRQFQSLPAEQRAALLQSLGNQVDQSPADQAPAVDTVDADPEPRAIDGAADIDEIERNAQQAQEEEELDEDEQESENPEPLLQFGYELFAGTPTTFAPATNIPVPLNYVVGPTDSVIIQLYGQRNERYEVTVTREGVLEFPEIGPINVAGLTFAEMREQINTTVSTSLIGQQVSVTMGTLRSIQIFVLGEAFRPGSYTVSSLSTMTNALFSSGGVTRVGSLRDIRLMRQGQLVTSLDLYDLLLRGDTSGDARLQPNDVIFIPPIGRTFGIAGNVRRPAIFELADENTLAEALPLAGGLLPTAFPRASRVERINAEGERTLLDVDLTQEANLSLTVRDGDVLQIYSILDQVEGVVVLEGHVNRPGGFAWREGMRVTDIITNVGDMLPNPDLDYALIARERQPNRTLELVYINLREALRTPDSNADEILQARDRLIIFGAAQDRQEQLEELLGTLRSQESFDQPAPIVSVEGAVNFPGEYPLSEAMTLDDIVQFSGGLADNADIEYVVLQREVDNSGTIAVESLSLNAQSLQTDGVVNLQAGDRVLVFDSNEERLELLEDTLDQLREQANVEQQAQIVSISGDVRFPGEYPLTRNLDVSALLEASGGLLQSADYQNAEITRFRQDTAIGRESDHLAINLQAAGQRGLGELLQPFDTLVVRRLPNWSEVETVTIGGEVRSPGSYVISKDETISQLVSRAGGLTNSANPRAAIFLREDLRENEQALIAEFKTRLRESMLTQSLSPTANQVQPPISSEVFDELLNQVEATGRLVINLQTALNAPSSESDVLLKDGDELLVPGINQEITVLGEVQRSTSHIFDSDLGVRDYIQKSGGFSQNASRNDVYIIKSSGDVIAYGSSRWFFERDQNQLEPGDSIVVPFDIKVSDPLYFLTGVSQVLFNMATAVLAINSVQN